VAERSDRHLADTKRRIVERLKRVESATATDLAVEFGLTDTALRQHLDALEAGGLVIRSSGEHSGRGRPPVRWQLAPAAAASFPDRHGELTVELLESIRTTLGQKALDRIVAARAERQTEAYSESLAGLRRLADRVQRLAELRAEEGYLAEVRPVEDSPRNGRSGVMLIEHHCPIREAAGACGALCTAELETFRRVLGPDVTVTRVQHVLSGDRRCAYHVEPADR
jgi:predicted ArsR family transcriptional regulator